VNEIQFQILRSAVNLSRNYGIRTLPTLVDRLKTIYPEMEEDIKVAISTWSDYVKNSGSLNNIGRKEE
jgi:hypothetical protein